jgi:peptidyl-prolyl cis-trans isomerase D
MFDFVYKNKRLVHIVLLLVMLPFVFFGINSYVQQSERSASVATVEGEQISRQELDVVLRQKREQMAQMTGRSVDAALFEQPETKHAALEGLINQKLLAIKARAAGINFSDEQLTTIIQGIGTFQTDGKFDRKLYEARLRDQKMTPQLFETLVRQELAVRQLTDIYTQSGYASSTVATNLLRLNEQQRTVSVSLLAPESFIKQAKVDDAAIKAYYDSNAQAFRTPERARVSYVLLTPNALTQQITVSEEEVKKYYEQHRAEFGADERRAAHILIPAPASASAADKQAARAKAEQILQQLKQSPGKFAELAKQYSGESGSAGNGGDLGFFKRGVMGSAFDDAAFALKPGEISGVVQSDFGFHIIKLLEIKAAQGGSFEQMKAEIAKNLKQQKAADQLADLADKFSNAVYEQNDSLQPAADIAKVSVQQSGWLTKGQAAPAPWNDKALQAVFSDDVIKQKRNSGVIEIAPDTLLAVHLLEYQPVGTRPLAEVSDSIRQQLLQQEASKLAVKQGQSILEQLQGGSYQAGNLTWQKAQTITRSQRAGMDVELSNLALRAATDKLPAYVGAPLPQGGYAIARLEAVKEATEPDAARRAVYMQQLYQLTGDELLLAYLADARKRASIKVHEAQLNAKTSENQ